MNSLFFSPRRAGPCGHAGSTNVCGTATSAFAKRLRPDKSAGPTWAAGLTSFLTVALSLVLTGCGDSHASVHTHTEPAAAAQYKAGHGLQLSPTASQFIGLKTIAVSARDVLEAKAVTAIPGEALLRTIKGDFVFVANGAWFLRTPVQIGAADGAWFEVKDGLYEGDTIVTHGAQALWLAELQAVNGGVGCADGH